MNSRNMQIQTNRKNREEKMSWKKEESVTSGVFVIYIFIVM